MHAAAAMPHLPDTTPHAAAAPAAGFLLFVALACWFVTHPPTPLAVTAEHVEALTADMQAHLAHLHVADNLQALSHSLSDRVHALEHALEGKLSHASHALSDNLHSMQDALSSNLAQLQQGLHSMEAGLTSGASNLAARASSLHSNLGSALRAQLAPIVQWPVPRWPVFVYFAGACVCLLTSGVCHLLGCCQRHIAEMVWRFDYAGIAVLIVASFVPAMYYAFLCEPFWRNFYLLTTTGMGAPTPSASRTQLPQRGHHACCARMRGILRFQHACCNPALSALTLPPACRLLPPTPPGCVVVGLSLPTRFQARQYRALRAVLFTLLGAWGVVPVTHQLLFHGHVWAIRRAFVLDLGMGLIYLVRRALHCTATHAPWACHALQCCLAASECRCGSVPCVTTCAHRSSRRLVPHPCRACACPCACAAADRPCTPAQCGAVIYACRIPERWYPGRFDIAGHSHQLWHSAVVLAALVHYNAMMVLLQWRDASGGCAAPGSVNGPLHEVLGAMQLQGQAPLGGIEQVYEHVGLQLQRLSAAAAVAGAPLAA